MPMTVDEISVESVIVDGGTDEQFAVVTEERSVVICDAQIGPPGKSALKASASLGDGTNTSFSVVHNFNSKAVIAQVRDSGTGEVTNACRVFVTDENSISVEFPAAPSEDEYTVTVLG